MSLNKVQQEEFTKACSARDEQSKGALAAIDSAIPKTEGEVRRWISNNPDHVGEWNQAIAEGWVVKKPPSEQKNIAATVSALGSTYEVVKADRYSIPDGLDTTSELILFVRDKAVYDALYERQVKANLQRAGMTLQEGRRFGSASTQQGGGIYDKGSSLDMEVAQFD